MTSRSSALTRAASADSRWLRALLDREGKRFGTRTETGADGRFELKWKDALTSRTPSP